MNIENKHLKAHKITNGFFIAIIIPFLLLALLSAMIMFNTKAAGGYANFLGYYVYEVPNDSFKKSTMLEHYDYDPYVKGAVFLFRAVSANELKSGDMVIYYSNTENNKPPIESDMPNWQPLNQTINPTTTQLVGESNMAEVKMAELASKKAVVYDENGKAYTCFAYYSSIVKIYDHTNAGDDLLVYDNIIGVVAENQSPFLIWVLQFCSSINGFLTLVLLPCVLLVTLKLLSIYFYRRYAEEDELAHDKRILADDKVSYNQAIRGARLSATQKAAPVQSGRIASTTRTAKPNTRGSTLPKGVQPKQSASAPQKPAARTSPPQRGSTVQRTAPKPRETTPVQRTAPKPRIPKKD